jgi:hypothetical protein
MDALLTEYPNGFKSLADYLFFRDQIESNSNFKRVPVLRHHVPSGFVEMWFLHLPTRNTYRLIEPDPPFRVAWEIVLDRVVEDSGGGSGKGVTTEIGGNETGPQLVQGSNGMPIGTWESVEPTGGIYQLRGLRLG